LANNTHNTQDNRGTFFVGNLDLFGLPTDWLLTIPSGNPPTWGDKCDGTGDGRRAAAAAAATAAAAA